VSSDRIDSQRQQRIASAIREIVAQAIVRGVRDVPRGPITVSRVEVKGDAKAARVFVSIFGADAEEVLDRLAEAQDEFRRLINSQLRMKNVPRLEFVLDSGLEKMIDLNRRIDRLKNSPTEDQD
jgi:ribosome-binding factor A